ncbi:la-related protein 1-like [Rhinophrynus dorsalis]
MRTKQQRPVDKRNNKENDQEQYISTTSAPGMKEKSKAIEAPLPRVNPWTKKQNLATANNVLNLHDQSGLSCSTKVIKAGKLASKKASDFNDITNWPTPSETAKHGFQHILNNWPNKNPVDKMETRNDEKPESKDLHESKENQEVDEPAESLTFHDLVEATAQKKKYGVLA